jgi:RND superfamily putative drug exporter
MPRYLLTNTPQPPRPEDDRAEDRSASGVGTPVRGRKSLIALFSILLIAWVGIAGVGGPYFGKISDVATNDRSTFLPESSESTRAQEIIDQFSDDDAVPAIVVLADSDGVSDDDSTALNDLADSLDDDGVLAADASPAIPSDDGEALELVLPVSSENTADDVESIRAAIADAFPDSTHGSGTDDGTAVSVHVTGPAGFAADLTEAFAGIDGILLLVALIAVFVILVIVYRSPLLPVIVLFTSVAALAASIFVVWHLADAEVLLVNGQVQGILFILVVGATTDYSLLVVARFRDALLTERDRVRAGLKALRGVLEPILASGGTVIASLLVLLLTDLASTRALGPVAAIGIAMAITGRTDVPARRTHDHRSGRVLALPAEGAPRLGEHRPQERVGSDRLCGRETTAGDLDRARHRPRPAAARGPAVQGLRRRPVRIRPRRLRGPRRPGRPVRALPRRVGLAHSGRRLRR